MNYDAKSKIFKAFCDSNRIMIIELLQSGEQCACVLQEKLSMPQSTLSHHMRVLCESGIVIGRKEGKWTHYSISKENSKNASNLLQELTNIK